MLYVVLAFTAEAKNISVRIYLDNITAVAYFNHGGGTRSAELTGISAVLTEWCESRAIDIEAVYLQGRLNIVADEESLAGPDAGDWRLSPAVFETIPEIWQTEVDIFAWRWNAQLRKFISWRPQPQAMMVNAFTINCKDLAGYVFPLLR